MNTLKSLLNQLCGADDKIRGDIESQLNEHFLDPFYVSRSASLPENDVLKTEARIISDAFEAVTNGMYDAETLSELKKISATSFFIDWKHLTEALYFLYRENFTKADEVFKKISHDSIPHLLAPVFYQIISRNKPSLFRELTKEEKLHINSVIRENLSIKSSLDQVENSLKSGEEEQFLDYITLLLTDLYPKNQNLAKRLAAWALKQYSVYDMSPSIFLENLKLIFGETESYRLTAIAFKDEDPELSLVFFVKTALQLIRSSMPEKELIEAYIDIITDMLAEVEKEKSYEAEEEDDEMSEKIRNILTVLEREISLHYPGFLDGKTISVLAEEKLKNTKHSSDIKNPVTAQKKISGNSRKPVQLELFF